MDHERARAARLRSRRVRSQVAWLGVVLVLLGAVMAAFLVLPSRVETRAEGSGQDPVPGSRAPQTPRRVDVVGDSLIRQAESAVRVELAATGAEVVVRSEPSRSLDSAFIRSALGEVAAQGRARADERRVLVLATASNDALELGARRHEGALDASRASYRDALAGVLERFRDRCVVVVDAKADVVPLYRPDEARLVDDDLAAVVATHPNARRVAWSDVSRGAGSAWFMGDQLHFGPAPDTDVGPVPGAVAYAEAIAAAVETCP